MQNIGAAIDKTTYEKFLLTAGGRIFCLRCTAQSRRSGKQCGKPALNESRTQKCTHHGGRSTGPRTQEGKRRITEAHTTHGESTKAERQRYSKSSSKISMLEDCMFVLKMGDGKRLQGRKANGYRPIRTIEEVKRFLMEIQ